MEVPYDASCEEALKIAKSYAMNLPKGEREFVRGSEKIDEGNCDLEK